MVRQRRTLRIPEIHQDDSKMGMELLQVLLSFNPFKNPHVEWLPDESSILASFDFLGTGNKGFDELTLQLNLQSFVLPKLFGDKGPLVVHQDESLGFLMWDSEWSFWKCEVELGPDHCLEIQLESAERVTVVPCDETDVDPPDPGLIKRARNIASAISEEDARWRSAASDHLLDLYSNNWNDGPAIDSASFQRRLSSKSVYLRLDGTTEVWLSQDELFTDHGIKLGIADDGTVTDAGIEG